MIIAALVRFFKKIKANNKMSKAAKTSTVSKKYDYEKGTFIKLTNDTIKLSYTYNGKTAKVEHPLSVDQYNIFTLKIYDMYFNKKTNKLKTGQIFAAINVETGEIDNLFWESKDKNTKINF